MRTRTVLAALVFATSLAACSGREEAAPTDDGAGVEAGAEGATDGNEEAPVSILRPDIEQPAVAQPQLQPLEVTIGFPEGGDELSADAVAALESALASDQIKLGQPIIIGGHSDAGGSDDANMRASEARALAVAAWLIERGIDEDRIDVIVFGEQNPAEPNALPNGAPNEAGRAANRRVELKISVPIRPGATPASDASAETGD